MQLSSIVTVASGRPYNILAGADLNGDGNGGAFPPDRARANPADRGVERRPQRGTMPQPGDRRSARQPPIPAAAAASSVEAIFEVFNLFNRTNYTEINNIFGTGAYPASPLPDVRAVHAGRRRRGRCSWR